LSVVSSGSAWFQDQRLWLFAMPAAWSSDAPGWLYPPLDEPLGTIRFGASVPLSNVIFATRLGDLRPFAEYMQLFLVWEQGGTSTTVNVTLRVDVVGRDGNFGLVPHMLPNRAVHLRADAGASFYPSTQNVTRWWDQSGNGRHAQNTSGIATQMPALVDNMINGKRALQFDGGDILTTSSFSMSTFTVFTVFRQETGSAAGMVYEHGTNTPTTDGSYVFLNNTPTIDAARSTVSTVKGVSSATWASDSTFRIVRQDFGGTNATHTISINGTQQATPLNPVTTDPGTGSSTSQSLSVGARYGISWPMTGYVAEVLVYSPALTSTNALRLEREYFGPRYGIAVP
ncbi:MAG: hypothetical protein ACXVHL_36885, partial [Solirubrobacteraceae bacterium]